MSGEHQHGSGQPLPERLRSHLEELLGADFSRVRVHVGWEAPSIGASAFAIEEDLHFAPGAYQPATVEGLRLLGHELTHVLQQRGGRVQPPEARCLCVVEDPVLEAEAEHNGERAAALGRAAGLPGQLAAWSPGELLPLSPVAHGWRLAPRGRVIQPARWKISDRVRLVNGASAIILDIVTDSELDMGARYRVRCMDGRNIEVAGTEVIGLSSVLNMNTASIRSALSTQAMDRAAAETYAQEREEDLARRHSEVENGAMVRTIKLLREQREKATGSTAVLDDKISKLTTALAAKRRTDAPDRTGRTDFPFLNLGPLQDPQPSYVLERTVKGKYELVDSLGTRSVPSGIYQFVVLYHDTSQVRVGQGGHTSVSNGAAVAFAGQVYFLSPSTPGVLDYWDNDTGHYKTTFLHYIQATLPKSSNLPVLPPEKFYPVHLRTRVRTGG